MKIKGHVINNRQLLDPVSLPVQPIGVRDHFSLTPASLTPVTFPLSAILNITLV